MRKLSEKLEGGRRYIIHPDYKIGLEMLNEWINECKELEEKIETHTKYDDAIINLVENILSNGGFYIETFNESVLCKLMELRGTPIYYTRTNRDIEKDFESWRLENNF